MNFGTSEHIESAYIESSSTAVLTDVNEVFIVVKGWKTYTAKRNNLEKYDDVDVHRLIITKPTFEILLAAV